MVIYSSMMMQFCIIIMHTTVEQDDYKNLYEQSLLTIKTLKHELHQLKKLIYATKAERFIPTEASSSQQLSLDINTPQQEAVKITAIQNIEYKRIQTQSVKQTHPGRHPLPEHLERREQIIEPDDDIDGLKKIGEEITEELDYKPANYLSIKSFAPNMQRQKEKVYLLRR